MSEATSSPAADTSGQAADVSAQAVNETSPSAGQETPKSEPRKYKVKVAGEEREIDETELTKNYELREAAYKRMADAAKIEREHKAFVKQLEDDPIKILESKNPKFRQMAEKYLADKLMEEMMSPEQKRIKAIEEENRRYKEEQNQRETTEKSAREQADMQKAAKEIDVELAKALANTYLPKDEFTVARIATTMMNALKAGVDLSYEEAVKYTEENEIKNFRKGLATLDGDKLIRYLGEDIAEKIRKADIGRLKSNPSSARPSKAAPTVTPTKSASKLGLSAFEDMINKKRV